MQALGVIFAVISLMIALLVIGVVVYIIVIMVKNKDEKVKFKLSTKALLQVYLYVISALTLGIAVIGGSMAIKSSVSYIFGVPFSYTLQKANSYEETKAYDPTLKVEDFQDCYTGQPETFYNEDFCFDSSMRKSDLINGITLVVSMSLLYALHRYAISKIKEKDRIDWLKKIYTFGSLILYSVISIVAIPTGIYNLTNFLVFEPTKNMYSTPEAPAMPLAITLIAIPLWIYFLRKTTELKED